MLNRDFAADSRGYKIAHDLPEIYELSPKCVPLDFEIERLRLRRLPYILACFIFSIAGYGFSLSCVSPTRLDRPATDTPVSHRNVGKRDVFY